MIVTLPELHAAQIEVARATTTHRFVCVSAGRRFGKSFCALVLACDRALRGEAVLWCAPITKTCTKAWTGVQEMLTGLPGIVFRHVDRRVEFPGGGRIQFVSADGFNRGDGGFDWLVLDEAGFVEETVWSAVLRPQLADRGGGALFISSPSGTGTWFHRMFLRGQEPGGDTKSFQFGSVLNPYLPPGEVEAARNDPSVSGRVFRAEWEASFESAEGSRIDKAWIRRERPPALSELVIAQGYDSALSEKKKSDWSACVTVGRDAKGGVWVLSADRVKASFHKLNEWVKTRAEAWHPTAIGIEQAGPSGAALVTELQRETTLPVRGIVPKGSKVERFVAACEGRIENGVIRFAPTVPQWLVDEVCEMGANPEHDDGADALAVAVSLVVGAGGAVEPSVIDRACAPITDLPNFEDATLFAALAVGRGVDSACLTIVARVPRPFDPRRGYDPADLDPRAFILASVSGPRAASARLVRDAMRVFEIDSTLIDSADTNADASLEQFEGVRIIDLTPDARRDLAGRLDRHLRDGSLRFAPIAGPDAAALRAETEALQRVTTAAGNVTYEGDFPRIWSATMALRAATEPALARGVGQRPMVFAG